MEKSQAPVSMATVKTSEAKPFNDGRMHQKGVSGPSQGLSKDLKKPSAGGKEKKRLMRSLAELTKVAPIVGPAATSAGGTGNVPRATHALPTYAHLGRGSSSSESPNKLELVSLNEIKLVIKKPRQKLPFRRNPELMKKPAIVKEPEVVEVSDDSKNEGEVDNETVVDLYAKPTKMRDFDLNMPPPGWDDGCLEEID